MTDAEDDYFGTADSALFDSRYARTHHGEKVAMPTKVQLEREVQRQRAKLDRAEALLEALAGIPDADPFLDGAAFHFRLPTGGYDYIALRASGLWYTTGRTGPHRSSWLHLIEWLIGCNVTEIVWLSGDAEPTLLTDIARHAPAPADPPAVVTFRQMPCRDSFVGQHSPHPWGSDSSDPVFWCRGEATPTIVGHVDGQDIYGTG